MKRTRLKHRSEKREAWEETYRKLKACYHPTECARCGKSGDGWNDLECHHPYLRGTEAFMMCFLPLCNSCHDLTHAQPNKAREEGWLVKPIRYDIFGNRRP